MTTPDPDKTRQVNLMLAGVTGTSLACLTLAASAYGPPGLQLRPLVLAPAVVVLYLLINRFVLKRPARPPLIQLDSPITWILATVLPLIMMACALAAMTWPGHNYAVAVIVGGVWFGLTLESAFRTPPPG